MLFWTQNVTPQLLHFQRTPVNSSNTAGPTRCDVSVRFYKKKEERKQPVYVPATLPEHWAESCKLRENNGDVFKSKLILGFFSPPHFLQMAADDLAGRVEQSDINHNDASSTHRVNQGRRACSFNTASVGGGGIWWWWWWSIRENDSICSHYAAFSFICV